MFARDVNNMISVHTNMFVFEALTMLGAYARRSTSGRDSWRTSRQHYFAKFPHVYGANFSAIPFWFSLKSTVPWIYLFRINLWKLRLIYSNRSLEKIAWFNWNGQMDAVAVVSFRFQIVHLFLSVISLDLMQYLMIANLFGIPRHIWIANYSNSGHYSYPRSIWRIRLFKRNVCVLKRPDNVRFGFKRAFRMFRVTFVFFSSIIITACSAEAWDYCIAPGVSEIWRYKSEKWDSLWNIESRNNI